jgi:hypothetical protein
MVGAYEAMRLARRRLEQTEVQVVLSAESRPHSRAAVYEGRSTLTTPWNT